VDKTLPNKEWGGRNFRKFYRIEKSIERMEGQGVIAFMPRSIITIEWEQGLHLRAAARVVRCAQQFRSAVTLRLSGNVANAKNILSIVALCAVMGSTLEIEAVGDDEQDALQAVEMALTGDGGSDAVIFKTPR